MLKEWINSDVEFKGIQKNKAIHIAASKGEHQICVILYNNGSEMNPKDAEGLTPMH